MPAHTRASITSLSISENPSKLRVVQDLLLNALTAIFVGAEEVLERVNERTSCAGVPRGVVGEWRRGERQPAADRCCWVEQWQPHRIGLSVRVAVGVGLSDRRYRPPELPIILVVPAADRGISRG